MACWAGGAHARSLVTMSQSTHDVGETESAAARLPVATETSNPSTHRWPGSVFDSGHEPDPRFSLANERTFLAWIRTSLALLATAAVLHALDLGWPQPLRTIATELLALAGLWCSIRAWLGWLRTEHAMRNDRPLPTVGSGIVLALSVSLVATLMALALTWPQA